MSSRSILVVANRISPFLRAELYIYIYNILYIFIYIILIYIIYIYNILIYINIYLCIGFPGSSAGKEFACNAGDLGLLSGLGRSSGHDNPLQYSCLENPHGQRCLVGYLQRVGHD